MDNIPPQPRQTRFQFIFSKVAHLSWYIFLYDLAQTIMDVNPLFAPTSEQGPWHIRSEALMIDIFKTLVFMTRTYAIVVVSYEVLAVVAVATFISEPKYWPAYVGRWSDAYTVRLLGVSTMTLSK